MQSLTEVSVERLSFERGREFPWEDLFAKAEGIMFKQEQIDLCLRLLQVKTKGAKLCGSGFLDMDEH